MRRSGLLNVARLSRRRSDQVKPKKVRQRACTAKDMLLGGHADRVQPIDVGMMVATNRRRSVLRARKIGKFCKKSHAAEGMVDVHNRKKCRHDGCLKHPTFEVVSSQKMGFMRRRELWAFTTGGVATMTALSVRVSARHQPGDPSTASSTRRGDWSTSPESCTAKAKGCVWGQSDCAANASCGDENDKKCEFFRQAR